MSEQHGARVCTRERGRKRERGLPGHAAGQGSTFASRVHIIPSMFAKSTCRRKMNRWGKQGGCTLSHIGIRTHAALFRCLVLFPEREGGGRGIRVRWEVCKMRFVKRESLVVEFYDSSFLPYEPRGTRYSRKTEIRRYFLRTSAAAASEPRCCKINTLLFVAAVSCEKLPSLGVGKE